MSPIDVPAVQLSSQVGPLHLASGQSETLHNIVKHAGATEVWLRLRFRSAEEITLTIEDNGAQDFKVTSLAALGEDSLGNLSLRLEARLGIVPTAQRAGDRHDHHFSRAIEESKGPRTWL